MRYLLTIVAAGILFPANSQDQKSLEPFDKIVISTRINAVLTKGSENSIRIDYGNVPEKVVNIKLNGRKLKVYLDHARTTERKGWVEYNGQTTKRGIYEGMSMTVYITYTDISAIDMRGEGSLVCNDALKAEKFRLKAYGENRIDLASLSCTKFKTTLYGENILNIRSGETSRQVYVLFGENMVETGGFNSVNANTRIYGEGKIKLHASQEVHVSALGEPTIEVGGTSFISKGIVLGRANIQKSH